jgi:hypothetical protein
LALYIVDFLCVGAKLIVEADGSQHAESFRDNIRDAYLASQGWKVLRFWNNEMVQKREGVLETILAHASRPSSCPSGHPRVFARGQALLPEGEGALNGAATLPPQGEGGALKARRMSATDEG